MKHHCGWLVFTTWLALLLGTPAVAWTQSPAPPVASAVLPAQAVLVRLLGTRARDFSLHLAPAQGKGDDWYAIHAKHGQVDIQGSSNIALVHGAYVYLQSHGLASVNWDGIRVALPSVLPDAQSSPVRAAFHHRVFLNPCTYGYTTPWWGWPQWQREIDWMALHGIDMPLALEGQEAVWRKLWTEFGLSQAQLADYFSGPAFLPWQHMGNIAGHMAPLSLHWIDDKQALQQRILARMRALGMHPVLPAFAGYVPKAFALAHPKARIYRMRAWQGFHETYWLDPTDPLFAKLATRFITLYQQTYGAGDYYLADAFNEMLPPLSRVAAAQAKTSSPALRDRQLAGYGQAIYAAIHAAAPQASWVMQSWMFGADRAFWTPDAIAAFLQKLPADHALVLDIGNDRYPDIWTRAHAFVGKRWVYGYVFNYGDSNPRYGDLDYYHDDLAALLGRHDTGRLDGFGVFPEGLHNDALIYAYLFALAWEGPRVPVQSWLADYLRARYGKVTPALLQAWVGLRRAVYRTRYWSPRWWHGEAGAYLFFRRPSSDIAAFPGAPGDTRALGQALRQLLAIAPAYADSTLFDDDLAAFARHYGSLVMNGWLQQAVRAYQHDALDAGDAARARVRAMAVLIDALPAPAGQRLDDWLQSAADYAHDATDRRAFVRNARALITVWGGDGNLHDYASRAWSGMYTGFYLPRWQRFLDAWRQAVRTHRPFDEAATRAAIARWEWIWVEQPWSGPQRPATAAADAPALTRRILELAEQP